MSLEVESGYVPAKANLTDEAGSDVAFGGELATL